jgi:hypothetical protein
MRICNLAAVVLLAALLAAAGAAQAQVAAPRLNPVFPESFGTINPGTMPWSGPSRVGAGVLQIEVKDPAGGPPEVLEKGKGPMVQGRVVVENVAVGAEALSVELDVDPSQVGGLTGVTHKLDVSAIQAGVRFGEVFSIGIGQQKEKETSDFPGIGSTSTEETLPMVGVTLRLGGVFYLGAAGGTATIKESGGGGSAEADRSVKSFGVAYHKRDADQGFHLEAYKEIRDSIDPATNPAGIGSNEQDTTGYTIEVVLANILLGYGSGRTDETDIAGVDQGYEKSGAITLGWAPGQGLAVTLAASTIKLFNPSGVQQNEIALTFVGIGLLF